MKACAGVRDDQILSGNLGDLDFLSMLVSREGWDRHCDSDEDRSRV